MEGIDNWRSRHPNGEQTHSQAIATANAGRRGLPPVDYLVLDLEYQWAHRRFDMVAARRRTIRTDVTGWVEPSLVFIEVKSAYGACSGPSGLLEHANDCRAIIRAPSGQRVQEFAREYENVIAQKKRLGFLDPSLEFKRFAAGPLELLMVFVDLDPQHRRLVTLLNQVRGVATELGEAADIRYMELSSPSYAMWSEATVALRGAVGQG
jgi:hypothetical protein